MCFAASPDKMRSPLQTSLRSLQAVRNSRSLEGDDCQPPDQSPYPPPGLDPFAHIKKENYNNDTITALLAFDQFKIIIITVSQVCILPPEQAQAAALHHFPRHLRTPAACWTRWETRRSGPRPWRGCRGLTLSAPAGSLSLLRDTVTGVFLPHLTGPSPQLGPDMHHPFSAERLHNL